jgi:hypothetical protein
MIADQPGWPLIKITQQLLVDVAPDILYVPFLNDIHKEHRELFHSLSVAWRPTAPVGTNGCTRRRGVRAGSQFRVKHTSSPA